MQANSDIQEIPLREFQQSWRTTYISVFSGRNLADYPFSDEAWRQYGIGAPTSYLGAADPDHKSMVERDHCKIYGALLSAVQLAGDVEIVQFLVGGPYRNASIFRAIRPTRSSWESLRMRPDDGFDRHLFGRSGKWGLAISWDEELAVVGGTQSFIDDFLKRAGGEDALRRDFLAFSAYLNDVSEEWRGAVLRLKTQAGW